jgi:hypothetical protein
VTATASIRLGRSSYPLVLPRLSDPRLHLAAVIVSLQVLGQVALGFDLSIAQILVSLGTCAVIEVGVTFWQRRVVAWPASALLTGNGVAFILRVPGTVHGDWWSTRGLHLFVAIAALSLLSKYLVRARGRHLFNPSNIGLVVGFLILGSAVADPQDLWWGPLSPAIVATLLVIFAGGVLVTTRQGLLGVAAGFFLTFAAGSGLLAARGHCMTARWHVGPVCGHSYWWVLVTSPEVLVFLFFMITDPRTIPAGRVGRILHGALVGAAAVLLAAPQTTEFATKVAILSALVLVCAARPLLERWAPPAADARDRLWTWLRTNRAGAARPARRLTGAASAVVVVGAAIVGAGTPARTPLPTATAPAAPPLAAATRPEVHLAAGAVPRPAIDDTAARVQPPVDRAQADAMAHDLVEDLVLETRAVRTGDRDLAAAVATGPRLLELRDRIASGDAAADRYRAERLRILRYQDPASPQAPPTFAVRLEGTVRSGAGAPRPIDRTFVLAQVGGRWAIHSTV